MMTGQDRKSALHRAQRHTRRRQFARAAAICDALLRQNPEDLRVLHMLAELQIFMGEYEGAIRHLQELARLYHQQGPLQWLISVCTQILLLDETLTGIRLQLAEAYLSHGDQQEAISQLRFVAKEHLKNGRTDELQRILERLVELDPDNIDDHIRLGQHYSRNDDPTRAALHFSRAAYVLRKCARACDSIHLGELVVKPGVACLEVPRKVAGFRTVRRKRRKPNGELRLPVLCPT